MKTERFHAITSRYRDLTVAVAGDFCLDRYLEIDPTLREVSIETGLPVHNVSRVRAQPGGAGTIVNNLAALGVGRIVPIGFCGDDGEGYELRRELAALPGVGLDHFLITTERRTFTYCKPLVCEAGRPPVELSRLDSKNRTPTPGSVDDDLKQSITSVGSVIDALIVLEQVDIAGTGVVTDGVLQKINELAVARPELPILGDSRRGLAGWPAISFKMNAAELAAFLGRAEEPGIDEVKARAGELAARHARPVFVTLAGRGIVAAGPGGTVDHVPALPVRGPIDVVGAGDAVTANLAAALAAGASVREAIEMAAVASSLVIHQLGTTGTASVGEMAEWIDQVGSSGG
jgi:rfaE bifunctional protein kinase chain/domain